MQTSRVQCNVIQELNDCIEKKKLFLSGQWESLRPPIDGPPKRKKRRNENPAGSTCVSNVKLSRQREREKRELSHGKLAGADAARIVLRGEDAMRET